MHIQGIHGSQLATAGVRGSAAEGADQAGASGSPGGRSTPLRVDAQRNLEHVLRAAREVFGELGYGAPMEDVARRARVGVGTVYRRFPSKDVLVRRIAEEETARLTEQARSALGQEDDPWSALSRFLRTSVASGAGRLLPPRVLRADGRDDAAAAEGQPGAVGTPARVDGSATVWGSVGPVTGSGPAEGAMRVPQQRQPGPGTEPPPQPGLRLVEQRPAPEAERNGGLDSLDEHPGAVELLGVVGQLVERARAAGELRTDVAVSDVLLVIATAAPSLPDAAQQAAASTRLLDILLEGLRSRPSGGPSAAEG